VYVDFIEGVWDKLKLERITEDERKERIATKIALKERNYQTNVGFGEVAECIFNCKKPIVGHNCFLDLLFIYQAFYGQLPDKCTKYKKKLHEIFPLIYDTKFIASAFQEEFKSTRLGDLFEEVGNKVAIVPVNGFAYDSSEDRSHEAGYDSYMTGVVFLHLMQRICKDEDLSNPFVESRALKKFENSMNLFASPSPFVVSGTSMEEGKPNVFHLSFNEILQTNDIYDIFEGIPIQIKWINNTSCFVIVTDLSLVKKVKEEVMKERVKKKEWEEMEVKISSYSHFIATPLHSQSSSNSSFFAIAGASFAILFLGVLLNSKYKN